MQVLLGNALEADGQGEENLEKIGNELQSIGNVTVISGLVIDFEDITQQKLIIIGNWIQALGQYRIHLVGSNDEPICILEPNDNEEDEDGDKAVVK